MTQTEYEMNHSLCRFSLLCFLVCVEVAQGYHPRRIHFQTREVFQYTVDINGYKTVLPMWELTELSTQAAETEMICELWSVWLTVTRNEKWIRAVFLFDTFCCVCEGLSKLRTLTELSHNLVGRSSGLFSTFSTEAKSSRQETETSFCHSGSLWSC